MNDASGDARGAAPGAARRAGRGRRRLRGALLAAIAALYALSIPWYREGGAAPALWLGLPDWVAVAALCYVGVALLNAWAWLLTDVADPAEAADAADVDHAGTEGGAP